MQLVNPFSNSTPNSAPTKASGKLANPFSSSGSPVASQQNKRGFLGEVLPILGAVGGGIAGEAADPFGGGIPGALVGMGMAGAGGAVGEAGQQSIEKAQGTRKAYDPNQIMSSGGSSAVGEGALRAAAPIAKMAFPKVLSFFSGYPEQIIKDAFTNPKMLVPGFTGGEEFLSTIVRNSAKKIGEYSDKVSTTFKNLLSPIAKKTITAGKEAVDGLVSKIDSLLAERNIIADRSLKSPSGMVIKGVEGDPNLTFSSNGIPSALITNTEQTAVRKAYQAVNSLKNGLPTAEKLNAVLRVIGELRDFTKAGGDASKEVLGRIYHQVGYFIKQYHPDLTAVRDKVAPMEELLNNIREVIPQKTKLTAGETDDVVRKLVSLFNEGKGETRKAVDSFGSQVGTDIMGTTKGAILKGGKPTMGIPPTTASSYVYKLLRFLPKEIVKAPVRFADVTEFVNTLVNHGVPAAAIRIILQNTLLGGGKKQ